MKMYIPKKHMKIDKDYIKASEMSEQTAKGVAEYHEQLKGNFWNQFLNLCQALEIHDFPPIPAIESMCEAYKKNCNDENESIQ